MVRERTRRHADPKPKSIWDKPRIKRILAQPVGSPIELTREEALAIVREGAGSMPHLPDGAVYTREARKFSSRLIER